jgi:hypothetical protein
MIERLCEVLWEDFLRSLRDEGIEDIGQLREKVGKDNCIRVKVGGMGEAVRETFEARLRESCSPRSIGYEREGDILYVVVCF